MQFDFCYPFFFKKSITFHTVFGTLYTVKLSPEKICAMLVNYWHINMKVWLYQGSFISGMK